MEITSALSGYACIIHLKEMLLYNTSDRAHNIKIIRSYLQRQLQIHLGIKWILEVNLSSKCIQSVCTTTLGEWQLDNHIDLACNKIHCLLQHDEVQTIDIKIVKYSPIHSCIALQRVWNKHAILKTTNDSSKSFMLSVLSGLQLNGINNKRLLTGFNMRINEVSKFEKAAHICVNVFTHKRDTIIPLYITDKRHYTPCINLFYLDSHFFLIKNMSRFLAHQTKNTRRKYYCNLCLRGFTAQRLLHNHCCKSDKRLRKKKHYFINYKNTSLLPLVICATAENGKVTYTSPEVANHVTCNVNDFLANMIKVSDEFAKRISRHYDLTEDEELRHANATHCRICNKVFKKNESRVRDHDHWTGVYRGAAHNSCNLRCKINQTLPVVMNDSFNFIISKITDDAEIISDDEGYYKTVCFRKIRFLNWIFSYAEKQTDITTTVNHFRRSCMSTFGLDPIHYNSMSHFVWDAMLKLTNVKLESITDRDMYTLWQNAWVPSNYHHCLPTGNFYWGTALTRPKHEGYIAEIKFRNNDTKYILHHEIVKLCLDAGMVLECVYKVLHFSQSSWLVPYIQFNQKINQLFSKAFLQHMNTVKYNKTESVYVARDETRLLQLSSMYTFKSFQICNGGIVAVYIDVHNSCNIPIYLKHFLQDEYII